MNITKVAYKSFRPTFRNIWRYQYEDRINRYNYVFSHSTVSSIKKSFWITLSWSSIIAGCLVLLFNTNGVFDKLSNVEKVSYNIFAFVFIFVILFPLSKLSFEVLLYRSLSSIHREHASRKVRKVNQDTLATIGVAIFVLSVVALGMFLYIKFFEKL